MLKKFIALFHFIIYLFPVGIKATQQIKESILNTPVAQSVDLFQGTWIESAIDLHIPGLQPVERSFDFQDRDLSAYPRGWNFSYPNMGREDSARKKIVDHVSLDYDADHRLTKVQRKDHDFQLLPYWITFEYLENRWVIKTSSNDYLTYNFSASPLGGLQLDYVSYGEKTIHYTYLPHPKERRLLISERKESDGVWLKMEYNVDGKLTLLKRSLDQGNNYFEVCHISYEQDKTLLKTPQGASYLYSFNFLGQLLEIATFAGDELYRREEFRYHNGNITLRAVKDSSGLILKAESWTYDLKGNLLSETLIGPLTNKNQIEEEYSKFYKYNQLNQPIEESEANNCSIEYCYDERQRPSAKLFKKDQQIRQREFYFYDDKNRLIETCSDDGVGADFLDLRSVTVRYKVHYEDFHCLGMPQTIIKSCWDRKKNEWIEVEKETQKYSPEGAPVDDVVKIQERGIEILIAADSEKRSHYNVANQLILEEEFYKGALKEENRFSYNASGFLIEKINHAGETIHYEYDFLGRKVKELFPSSEWIEYVYDPLDRIIEVINSDGCHEKILYNARNQILQILRHELLIEDNQYQLNGTIIKNRSENSPSLIQDSNAPSVAMEFYIEWITTEEGILQKQASWNHVSGSTIRKRYDFLDRVSEARIESPNGELLLKTTYQYNLKGQKKEECRYENVAGELQLKTRHQWNFDLSGMLLSHIENDLKITHYTYNSLGQLIALQQPSGVIIHYAYDIEGKLNRIYSSDHSIFYEISYDHQDRIISSITPQFSQSRNYNERGQVVHEDLGYGISLAFDYDQKGRREKIYLPDRSAIEYSFENDLLRKITRLANNLPIYSCNYLNYDNENRLTQLKLPADLGMVDWSWNSEGKLTAVHAPFFEQEATLDPYQRYAKISTKEPCGTTETSFEYDALAHLIQPKVDLHFTEHDLNGNLIKYDQWNFTYDAFNRLIKVTDSSHTVHEYLYDIFHRRIVDLITDEHYFYEGNLELGMMKNQNIQQLRVFGISPYIGHEPCVAMEFQNKLYVPLYDMQGSVKLLLSAETQSIQEHYAYTPYGECQQLSQQPSLNPWRFNNKRYDPSTGLLHFERRDYLPTLRQFTTADPYNELEGSSPYQYTLDDPINRRDLFGLKTTSQINNFKSKLRENLLSLKKYIHFDFYQLTEYMMGSTFLLLCGYHNTKSLSGVYGKGELNPKVRISFMNGILTDYTTIYTTLRNLSDAHGGENIHFVYRPTHGWVWDISHSILVRMGLVSSEAHLLAEYWKGMINEMGGVNGGGKIIHYAHSIGTMETFRALELLTVEEQAMIEVFAFGSPSLTGGSKNWKVSHFVSVRDGVSLLDSIHFVKACLGYSSSVTFIGSFWGIPLIDHFFLSQTYQDVWRAMGRTFMETYGSS